MDNKKYNRNTTGRLCLCGCGLPVVTEWSYNYNKPVLYKSGHNARNMSQKTKQKISISSRNRSAEIRRKLSTSMIKVWARKRTEGTAKMSDIAKENMRRAQAGRGKGAGNPMYGRRHSEKTKILMSQALREVWAQRRKGG